MDPAVEQILMAKAMQEAETEPTLQEAILMGGMGGAGIGVLAGEPVHRIMKNTTGRLFNNNHFMKPGARMAGGLVGLLLGGSLGAGLRQQAINDSPAAAILAKGQSQGLTEADKYQLARVLEGTYQDMGLR